MIQSQLKYHQQVTFDGYMPCNVRHPKKIVLVFFLHSTYEEEKALITGLFHIEKRL